jgi:hypothetical protein
VLKRTPKGFKKIVIFMSDGAPGDSGYADVLATMRAANPGLVLFTVGFHVDSHGEAVLKYMASGRDDKFLLALSGEQLTHSFNEIAADSRTVTGLVKAVSTSVSDSLASRLMLDCM